MSCLPEPRVLPNEVRAHVRAWVLTRLSAGPEDVLSVPLAVALAVAVLAAGAVLVLAQATGWL